VCRGFGTMDENNTTRTYFLSHVEFAYVPQNICIAKLFIVDIEFSRLWCVLLILDKIYVLVTLEVLCIMETLRSDIGWCCQLGSWMCYPWISCVYSRIANQWMWIVWIRENFFCKRLLPKPDFRALTPTYFKLASRQSLSFIEHKSTIVRHKNDFCKLVCFFCDLISQDSEFFFEFHPSFNYSPLGGDILKIALQNRQWDWRQQSGMRSWGFTQRLLVLFPVLAHSQYRGRVCLGALSQERLWENDSGGPLCCTKVNTLVDFASGGYW
jgi:hypothetical protein